jgi:hypothetical protein
MKINFTRLLALAALLGTLLFSTVTMAQSPYYRNNQPYYNQPYSNNQNYYYQQKRTIGERLQNQKARIAEGIREGSLSGREADSLRNRQVALERELAATSRNGYMSPYQYAHFENELDQMSQVIYQAKHNYDNRYNQSNRYGYGNRSYNNDRSYNNGRYNRPVNRRDYR